ncbi:cell division protein ZapA [bacterium]|nr:cell division protein ZapA [bacterium]
MDTPEDVRSVSVHIMGREYNIACPPEEQEHLIASAEYLHERMSAIRRRGKSMGVERIAIMAALNMAREILDNGKDSAPAHKPKASAPGTDSDADDKVRERLRQMELSIDQALADHG